MADLRYWDGQTWTQQTSATPVAFAAATLAPPVIPQQPSAPSDGPPYPPTRALPGSLAGSARSPMAAHRPSGVRVNNFYGVIAAGVAVAVAAAVAIPLVMHKSGHKSPTVAANQPITTNSPALRPSTAPTPVPSAAHSPATGGGGSYALPAQFAGYPRITDARATETEAEITREWPLGGTHVFGIYGGPTGDPKAMALFQTISLTTSGQAEIVRGAEQGLSSGLPGLSWEVTTPGSYGGVMQCATITEGTGGAVCVFADASTFGFTFVLGDPITAQAQAAQLRASAEAAPAI